MVYSCFLRKEMINKSKLLLLLLFLLLLLLLERPIQNTKHHLSVSSKKFENFCLCDNSAIIIP